MTREFLILLIGLWSAGSASAQARVAVGAGTAALGGVDVAFGNLVNGLAQVAPGLAAQRSYSVWWVTEAEAHVPVGPIGVGARVQGRWSQADALYGDWAGTVDVIGRTQALLGELDVAFPLGPPGLRVAAHAGSALVSTRLSADASAEFEGRTEQVQYRLTGTGVGPTVGASVLWDIPVGPGAISARLGARWGRVSALKAQETTDVSQTEGELRLGHNFDGVSLTVGVGL